MKRTNQTHTPGPWRVQADPLLSKRHPLHANRYVTTNHEMETWRSGIAEGHGDDCHPIPLPDCRQPIKIALSQSAIPKNNLLIDEQTAEMWENPI